jgi:hypothetical protein
VKRHKGNIYKTKQGLVILKFIRNLSAMRCMFIKEECHMRRLALDLSLHHTFLIKKQSVEVYKNWYG